MDISRRTAAHVGALVLVGAVGGAVLAATLGASAAGSSGGTPSPAMYAEGAPALRPDGPMRHGFGGPGCGGPGMRRGLPLSGTVTAVGSKSVSINVNGAVKTYQVDAHSDIDKSGEATLSDVAVGDKVRFALRRDGSTLAVLHTGDESKNMPSPPPGAPAMRPDRPMRHGFGPRLGCRLPLSGTVTAVGSKSVSINVNGAVKTYQVDAHSHIGKTGPAALSGLAVGDKVRFALRPDGSTIAVLHAGDQRRSMPGPQVSPSSSTTA